MTILSLNRILALAMKELAQTAGPPHAFAFKAKLVREAKNLIPGGLPMEQEPAVIQYVMAMIDATIAIKDEGLGGKP